MTGKKYLIIKRIFDIVFSLLLLILTFFVRLSIFLILFIQLKHIPIYKQKRMGKNGTQFYIYKYQTMYDNSDEMFEKLTTNQKKEYYKNYKIDNDPRVMRIGKILRNTALDELPQLINVLKGEMSIIGPRPVLEKELKKYKQYQEKLLTVLPGMTGYWQVNGHNNLPYHKRVKMDIFYIDNISFILDMKILIKTIYILFSKGGNKK